MKLQQAKARVHEIHCMQTFHELVSIISQSNATNPLRLLLQFVSYKSSYYVIN